MLQNHLHCRFLNGSFACLLVAMAGTTIEAQTGVTPEITVLSPSTIHRSGRLVVLGSGFGSDGQVSVDGLTATATTWTSTEIHAYVPEGASLGPVPVRVVTSAGASAPQTLSVTARQADGRTRWRFQFDSFLPGQHVAVAADGTIYATDNFRTYALTGDGGLKWVLPKGGGGRPIAVGPDGTVYTGAGGILAIHPDGTVKWEFIPPGSRSTVAGPALGPDGNLYAVNNVLNNGIGAYSVDIDGNLRWSDPGDPPTASFPGSNSEIVFRGSDLFFGVVTQGSSPPALWSFDANGNQNWYLGTGCESFPQMDPLGRLIVAGQGSCGVTALGADGKVVWNAQPPQSVGQLVQPAVGPDGVIYTADFFGEDFWALDADGSTRWFLVDGHGFMAHLGVSPDNSVVIDGGQSGFGVSGWVRGFDTVDGTLLWQVDLAAENGLNQATWSQRPAFSADSRTAYVTTRFAGDAEISYLYAIDIAGGAGTPPPPPTTTNQAPVAVATATPMTGAAPLAVSFDSTGSSDADGTITAYAWDFGDGATSSEANPGHVYGNAGSFVARLTVTDDGGAVSSASVTIDVTASGPCSENCLRVSAISLSARVRSDVTVNGRVCIRSATGEKIPDATVTATWLLPDGTQEFQLSVTNSKGKAQFQVVGGRGTYTLVVADVTKPGMTFDPDNSVLSASITK